MIEQPEIFCIFCYEQNKAVQTTSPPHLSFINHLYQNDYSGLFSGSFTFNDDS